LSWISKLNPTFIASPCHLKNRACSVGISSQNPTVKKSRLDEHRAWIAKQLAGNASFQEIRDGLAKKGCDVKHETVRKWIKLNKPVKYKGHKRGRRKSVITSLLTIFPDDPKDLKIPLLFELAPKIFAHSSASAFDAKTKVAIDLLHNAGIPVDETCHPRDWLLPAKALSKLTDLELCLLTYLLSDLSGPRSRETTAEQQDRLLQLLLLASRLKAKIRGGLDFTFAEV
jgi:hypothetical protein